MKGGGGNERAISLIVILINLYNCKYRPVTTSPHRNSVT